MIYSIYSLMNPLINLWNSNRIIICAKYFGLFIFTLHELNLSTWINWLNWSMNIELSWYIFMNFWDYFIHQIFVISSYLFLGNLYILLSCRHIGIWKYCDFRFLNRFFNFNAPNNFLCCINDCLAFFLYYHKFN
jgi:hypothetical protein